MIFQFWKSPKDFWIIFHSEVGRINFRFEWQMLLPATSHINTSQLQPISTKHKGVGIITLHHTKVWCKVIYSLHTKIDFFSNSSARLILGSCRLKRQHFSLSVNCVFSMQFTMCLSSSTKHLAEKTKHFCGFSHKSFVVVYSTQPQYLEFNRVFNLICELFFKNEDIIWKSLQNFLNINQIDASFCIMNINVS